MSHAAASSGGSTRDAPTPFYNQLMSVIHATALENGRAAQHDEDDAVSHAAHPRWRIHPLIPCIAGLIVVAAAGRALLVPEVSQVQPPIVTADAGNAPEVRVRVVDRATTPDEPAERPVPAAEPAVVARSDEQPLHAAGQPIANPASEQPPSADTPSSLPSAIETGSVERAEAPPLAIRIARIVSDVNMRAGPGNGQAVLATISRGTPVEVVDCRQWCEVVFAGQRGWVYKSFIAGR
jgi:hypothetical protein